MKYFLTIAGLMLAGLLLFTGCRGRHHGYGHHHKMNPERVSGKIASKLGMDKDQKAKLDLLVKRTFDQMPDLKKNHALMVDELIRQFESDTFEEATLNKVMVSMESDMKKAKDIMLDSGAEFHSMLKPEQRAKIVSKLKRHQKRLESRGI